MSKITFSFTVPHRTSTAKSKRNNANHSAKIIDGVICIDENANYSVKSLCSNGELKTYNISKSSYSCKNKEVIYRFNEGERGIMQLWRPSIHLSESVYNFKPFAPGVIVEGYLIKDSNLEDVIEIIKIHNIIDDDKNLYNKYYNTCKAVKSFYNDNWKTIHNSYEMKYGNAK